MNQVNQNSFAQFEQWSEIGEFLFTCNLLAVIMAVASVSSLAELNIEILIQYILFVTWVAVSFLVFLKYTVNYFTKMNKNLTMSMSFVVLLLLILLTSCFVNSLPFIHQQRLNDLTLDALFQNSPHRMTLGACVVFLCLRYQHVREQAMMRQRAELMAKVQALQARIHPHFLFNSLNSVVSLIVVDPFKAEQMLIDLSSLFRASLQEMKEVSLAEEIELCKRYLKIENIRLEERLDVNWIIDSNRDLSKVKIPLLSLQPLLENCIYHGVESVSTTSVVTILVEVKDKTVNIVLTNPFQEKNIAQQKQGNGIALENVKQRLLAYYGHSVIFQSYKQKEQYITVLSYQYN